LLIRTGIAPADGLREAWLTATAPEIRSFIPRPLERPPSV
jgi:hypothetical protein